MASFLKLNELASNSFKLFFCSFFTFSALNELKRVRAFLWIGFWSKGMLWLVWWFYPDKTFSISAVSLFLFLIVHMFNGVSLCISFKNFSFAFIHNLDVSHKRPSFQTVSNFNMPSSLSLIISSFCFKVRDMQLSPPIEHWEAIVRLLIDLISILLYLRE